MHEEHTHTDEAGIISINKNDDSDSSPPNSQCLLPSFTLGANFGSCGFPVLCCPLVMTHNQTRHSITTDWISTRVVIMPTHGNHSKTRWRVHEHSVSTQHPQRKPGGKNLQGDPYLSPLSLLLSPSSYYRVRTDEPSSTLCISMGTTEGFRIKGSKPLKELWLTLRDKSSQKSHSVPVILTIIGLEKRIQGRCGGWQW